MHHQSITENGVNPPSILEARTRRLLRLALPEESVIYNDRPAWLFGLELDVHFPELFLAVEFNGKQHYQFTPRYHADEYDFQRQQANDRRKLGLCNRRHVTLITLRAADVRSIRAFEACMLRELAAVHSELHGFVKFNLEKIRDTPPPVKREQKKRPPSKLEQQKAAKAERRLARIARKAEARKAERLAKASKVILLLPQVTPPPPKRERTRYAVLHARWSAGKATSEERAELLQLVHERKGVL